jgi:DNA-binding MarR family transcriptional regulator
VTGLATEFGSERDSTGLQLWRVTNAWQAAQRLALKPFGITHVQFVLLAALTWLDGAQPMTQRALAEYAGTDPMMTSQVLRALEAAGLVVRSAHPSDRRAKRIGVTAEGRSLANRAVVAVEACDSLFFSPLGATRPDFTRVLVSLST